MSMVVQHNISAMNANRLLGVTSSAQTKSTEKLSSGYRINRAADDAAGLSISEKMRKQIRGLTQASSNAQDGISTVQTAEGALSEVTDMLQRMNELSVQAANGSNSESDRSNIQDEIDQLTTEIDRVSETTKFNETYLLKGDVNAVKATDYQYGTQSVVSNTDLYTVGTDGKITTVAAGSTLATDVTYYTGTTSKTTGEAIKATDLTAGAYSVGEKLTLKTVSVGTKISVKDITGTTYAKSATLIKVDNLYTKDASGNYVSVKSGAIYNSAVKYYTMSSESGGVKYSAIDTTSGITEAATVASIAIYDANGDTVAVGTKLDTNNVYYSTISSREYDTNYVSSATLVDISTTDYYYKSGSSYVKLTTENNTFKTDVTYYNLSTASGTGKDYIAVETSSVGTTAGYTVAADDKIIDENGKALAKGTVIDVSKTFYGTDAITTGSAGKYATLVNVITSSNYYTKDSAGKFQAVASGSKYDSAVTYYTIAAGASTANIDSAVASTAVVTSKQFQVKSGVTLYDSTGAAVTAGTTIDTSKTYYSTYSVSTTVSGTVSTMSTLYDSATFQFQDKDGNDVAANGLYQYFDEKGEYDSSYNSGLFTKDASGKLVAATADDIKDRIDTTQTYEKGSLSLSFQVGADATTENKISFTLDAMDSKTLGIDGLSVEGADDTNARNSIETIKAALTKVSSQRSGLGAIQNRLEHTISNLDNIVENTTSAESKIRDTDMAKEMVNYSKNNILAQAGQSMLAQANQSNQGVLSLLQ